MASYELICEKFGVGLSNDKDVFKWWKWCVHNTEYMYIENMNASVDSDTAFLGAEMFDKGNIPKSRI